MFRTVTDEIMDQPGVAEPARLQALEGLRRINLFSRTSQQILKPILALAQRENLHRLSLLDIACGGGDVPIAVASSARSHGLCIDLTLLDRSPTALRRAQSTAERAQIPCRCIEGDALSALPSSNFDIVTSTLFLHHLPEPVQVINLLKNMRRLARKMVIISDLRRSRRALLWTWLGCRLISRSKIVHYDGPVSVRAAWTLQELSDFAIAAGMQNARISPAFPWRMILIAQGGPP
jgi:2-polyprenyl-3-methyl-5-hydroxy-6-metoxy-1,4-benzoquinol methylase